MIFHQVKQCFVYARDWLNFSWKPGRRDLHRFSMVEHLVRFCQRSLEVGPIFSTVTNHSQ